MRKLSIFLFPILLFLAIPSMGRSEGAEGDILAKVGDEVITRADFEARISSLPPLGQKALDDPARRKELLDIMIKARLFVIEAGNRGLAGKPDIQAALRILRDDFLTQEYARAYIEKKVQVSDEEAQNFYDTNPEIRERELLKVSRMALEKEEEAKEVLERLKKGENFKKLVKERSIDRATKPTYGEMEWFEKSRGQKEMVEALSNVKSGEISPIVKIEGRYYIFKLDERKIVPKPHFLDMKEKIIADLTNKKVAALAEKEVEELRKKVTLEVYYDKLTSEKK